ncbi:hypothetical protein GF360_04140 [candidate division WWE3 bacterium]|nr:hypothetical protein [candidate division WWE3 bacterium]
MITTKLQKKLLELQKAGDKEKVSVLRYLLSQVKNKEIELRANGEKISKEQVVAITEKQLKQRKETAQLYKDAGRDDLAEKDQREVEILSELLKYVKSQ